MTTIPTFENGIIVYGDKKEKYVSLKGYGEGHMTLFKALKVDNILYLPAWGLY